MKKDYYKILGVERNAATEEIKKAFYKLAHLYHPHKAGKDEKKFKELNEKFKEINEAYQVLSDKEKRTQYDRFGQVFEGAPTGGGEWPFGFGHAERGFGQGFDPSAGGGFNFEGDLGDLGDLGDFFANYVRDHSYHKKLRVRADTLGYAQRSFPGVVSEVDAKEARQVGVAAVKYAMKGDIDGSVVIKRISDGENYVSEISLAKLSQIAKKTKPMPRDFFNKDGNGVTKKFFDYIKPLVGELPKIEILF